MVKSCLRGMRKHWPWLAIVFIWVAFFWKFFLKGLLPIPSDIVVGMYYPWLDYKWGYPTGVPVKNPLSSDIPSIIYPWRMAVIDAYKNGRWPLWNPHYFLGMPLLANFQSAAFSLSNLFFLFLREPLAWSWGVVFQSLLSMTAMFFYLRKKKLRTFSSLLGAVVFSFSGFSVVWTEYNVHGWTMMFLPLILLLTDQYFETRDCRWLFPLSLAVAFQVFSGYLPVVIYTWLTVGLLLLWEKRVFKKGFGIWLAFVFLGFCLTAVQTFPGVELISRSIRKVDPSAVRGDVGYLPLKNLVTLVVPNFFGNPATGNFWGKPFYDNFSFSVGAIPLLLSFLALVNQRKRREVGFWGLVIGLGFLLSIKNPLGRVLEKILFLEGGISARALFLVDFSLSVLAAFGLESLLEDFNRSRKKLFRITFITGFSLALLTFLILIGAGSGERLVALRNSVIPWLAIGCFGGLLLAGFIKWLRRLVPWAVLVLVLFPLWYSAQKYWSFTPERLIFPRTPVIDFLLERAEEEPLFRIEPGNVIPQNMWMPYGLEAVSGYDTLMPKRQGELLSLVKNGVVGDKISRVHLMDNYNLSLFPLLNVKYILAKKITPEGEFSPEGSPPDTFLNPRFSLVFEDKTVQIYQDSVFLPRVWSVDQVLAAGDDSGLVRAMTGSQFDPASTAVIKEADWAGSDLGRADISFLSYAPGREEISLSVDDRSFLVESASFYPGWRAFLDGKEIDVFEADYGLRGYYIPQGGSHHLKVVFDPSSFKWGLRISLFSLVIWAAASFTLSKRFSLGDKKD